MTSNRSQPVVSVIVPTRSRHQWIKRTLDHIAAQTLDRFEVIVVDDGANEEALRAYDQIFAGLDDRFRFHKRPIPGLDGTGPAATRNRGIALARGRYLAFCDDDDWWRLPDHLQVGVEALEKSNHDFYFTDMQAENNGQVTLPSWFPDSPLLTSGSKINDDPPVHEVSLQSLLTTMQHHYPSFNTCILRRSLLDDTGLFLERLRCAEDINLILRYVDLASGILYRPQCAVTCNVTPRESAFTGTPKIELGLYGVAAAQHVMTTCQHRAVRRCARGLEAWNLRQIAKHLTAAGHDRSACSMLWQAWWTYPTLGTAAQLLRSATRVSVHALRSRPGK